MPKRVEHDQQPSQVNIIAKGTVIDGTLNAGSHIRINGIVLGQLQVAGRAVISESGAVKGTILAEEAMVSGAVEGDIVVKHKVMLSGTARITGTIKTARLVVEEGALLNGECQMGKPGEALKGKVIPHKEQASAKSPGDPPHIAAA